jgi:ribonuclease P protein component
VARAAAAAPLPLLPILIASAKSGRLTLPARLRMRHKVDFDAAYARGRRMSDGFFSVTARVNDAGVPRLGLAVAVKVAGNSVARNRLRRIIRESFRLHQQALPAADIVVSARPPAKAASAETLRVSLAALWKKVGEQCATSPLS